MSRGCNGRDSYTLRLANQALVPPFVVVGDQQRAESLLVNYELEPGAVGQMTDFKESNRRLEWSLKKIVGGSEHTLRAKLTCSQESHGNITKEAGPVSMTFTIPMYNPSRLQVKYLQIAKKTKTSNPYRWVRYVTQANSYVARI
ncbi:AP-4 complex subunit mu [Olea europaea subsp. europaea]|uniref:AP-4 complex subunit mu n=1 Tax=Olea europaea subsp. europaea TaxID=158383 RepID=A0A8S0QES4_OLEEU|nr:AP-4 complex subunit mu [Olea europaea subsp. europaea]